MKINEKNLAVWMSANAKAAPNKEAMQMARSLACEPTYTGENFWLTPSTTKENVSYVQTVYFTGIDEAATLNIGLLVECDCPAKDICIHALAVERKYHANWNFYFQLFGLPLDTRLGELHSRACAVAARMRLGEHFTSNEIDSHYDAPQGWIYDFAPECAA